MRVVRVRRHAWPSAHDRLLALRVPFTTGAAIAGDEDSGYVEVSIARALAPALDAFPRVRDELA